MLYTLRHKSKNKTRLPISLGRLIKLTKHIPKVPHNSHSKNMDQQAKKACDLELEQQLNSPVVVKVCHLQVK